MPTRAPEDRGPRDYADDTEFERGYRAGRTQSAGSIASNGSGKTLAWVLGLSSLVISTLLSLILQAIYSNSGDTREVKGQVAMLQDSMRSITGQVQAMQTQVSALQVQVNTIAAGQQQQRAIDHVR